MKLLSAQLIEGVKFRLNTAGKCIQTTRNITNILACRNMPCKGRVPPHRTLYWLCHHKSKFYLLPTQTLNDSFPHSSRAAYGRSSKPVDYRELCRSVLNLVGRLLTATYLPLFPLNVNVSSGRQPVSHQTNPFTSFHYSSQPFPHPPASASPPRRLPGYRHGGAGRRRGHSAGGRWPWPVLPSGCRSLAARGGR